MKVNPSDPCKIAIVTCFLNIILLGYLGNFNILKHVAAVINDLFVSYNTSHIVNGGLNA